MGKQHFKSIYFSDHPAGEVKEKSVTLAFSELEASYYAKVKELSTQEIKDLTGIQSYRQLSLFADDEERSINQTVKRLIKQNLDRLDKIDGVTAKDVTFVDSKSIPFQRWYPYIEGYSVGFVKALLKNYNIQNTTVYEPFAGTGTTLFAADIDGLKTVYSEVNPLLQFLIEIKVNVLKSSDSVKKKLSTELKLAAQNILVSTDALQPDNALSTAYKTVFGDSIYFPEVTLQKILQLRTHIDAVRLQDTLLADLLSVAVVSCLLPVSYLKKAGDVRYKTAKEREKELKMLAELFPAKLLDIAEDIVNPNYSLKTTPQLILSNAKHIGRVTPGDIGAVITSPPYLNGTNYFRNTKLELWFLRYLQTPSDLRFFRDQALTSGINDVRKGYAQENVEGLNTKSVLLASTLADLEQHAYDMRIPIMAKSYFNEMYQVFRDIRPHLTHGAKILIDIGDSIFCGVHINTDGILTELLLELGYTFIEHKVLRKRRSRNKEVLTQSLLAFNYTPVHTTSANKENSTGNWIAKWTDFKNTLPHQQEPYAKRNWGHPNHSLCSYQGKLKPAIGHFLIDTFVPSGGVILDPFAGVGTIPFEAAIAGKTAYGIDISLPAYYISSAKVADIIPKESHAYIAALQRYLQQVPCSEADIIEASRFGFNKTLAEYYEAQTLCEILLARQFIQTNAPRTPSEMLVVASLLHILHGNRPYALSRQSHPIVPYAPTGEFSYRSLINNLNDKVNRALAQSRSTQFKEGKIFYQDTTLFWPQEINNLDAVITSPPFYDSTRFYSANWIRIWFAGWSAIDFKSKPGSFVEEKQKKDFKVYESIFRQARERLKKDGVFVLHLGKSNKCDMAVELQRVSKRWFRTADLFDESVIHCESHGIRDKGTVTSHQYLVLV